MKIAPSLIVGVVFAASIASASVFAAEIDTQSVAALYQARASLAGKTVSASGNVVKVNNGIMGRNFVHLQDGSGDAADGSNNLVVTSTQTAQVGDRVSVTGIVAVDRDFGSGYSYPLLIEESKIMPLK